MNRTVCASLACWPGLGHLEAATLAMAGAFEPLFGALSVEHVQIVPQSAGIFDESFAEVLRQSWPGTAFRLHANVRVLDHRCVADLSGFDVHHDWFRQAARVHRALGARVYSAHSGLRAQASMRDLLDRARRCADLFDCPVAIEGQYPLPDGEADRLLVSSWAEYRALLESGVPFAVDLSHLNILAHRSGTVEMTLARELVRSEQCLEVHLSHNDGSGDWHQVCDCAPWWWELLGHIQPDAVIFSEGNHRRRRNERRAHELRQSTSRAAQRLRTPTCGDASAGLPRARERRCP